MTSLPLVPRICVGPGVPTMVATLPSQVDTAAADVVARDRARVRPAGGENADAVVREVLGDTRRRGTLTS